jgi:hypothetical protein
VCVQLFDDAAATEEEQFVGQASVQVAQVSSRPRLGCRHAQLHPSTPWPCSGQNLPGNCT